MTTKEEIERRLGMLGAGTQVWISEGGLALECEEGAFLEVGGETGDT